MRVKDIQGLMKAAAKGKSLSAGEAAAQHLAAQQHSAAEKAEKALEDFEHALKKAAKKSWGELIGSAEKVAIRGHRRGYHSFFQCWHSGLTW